MNLIDELRWRGMVQDIMPGTEELLNKEMVTGYINPMHLLGVPPAWWVTQVEKAKNEIY